MEVPDRLSVSPSPHSTFIEVTVPPFAELLRVRLTLAPVFAVDGPVTVKVGGR